MKSTRRAVRGLVIVDGMLLLMKFSSPENSWTGWIAPGGGVDEGESDLEALKRELFEELGFSLKTKPSQVWKKRFQATFDGVETLQTDHYYYVLADKFEVSMDNNPVQSEIDNTLEVRWFSLEDLIGFPAMIEECEMYDNYVSLLREGPPLEVLDLGKSKY